MSEDEEFQQQIIETIKRVICKVEIINPFVIMDAMVKGQRSFCQIDLPEDQTVWRTLVARAVKHFNAIQYVVIADVYAAWFKMEELDEAKKLMKHMRPSQFPDRKEQVNILFYSKMHTPKFFSISYTRDQNNRRVFNEVEKAEFVDNSIGDVFMEVR